MIPTDHVVVEDPTGARATIGEAAVEQHVLKGFKVLGPAVEAYVPVTVEEAEAAAEEAKQPKKSGTPAADAKKEK